MLPMRGEVWLRQSHEWRLRSRGRAKASAHVRSAFIGAALMCAAPLPAQAAAPAMSVGYQPMVATGLAARRPFEAWLWLNRSRDPAVPGYAIPAGATIRITFPKGFRPRSGYPLSAVMLKGWVQGPIKTRFSIARDRADPRTIVIQFERAIAVKPPDEPGLKAIHVRTAEINPARPGNYPITVRFEKAGSLTGTTRATAHITRVPLPNIAAYNNLSGGRDEEWQRVKAGGEAPLPIDFLVTLPNVCRSFVSLKARSDGRLEILSDGKPIGTIRTEGVPVTLTPVPFGPGFARLGIIRVLAKAGETPGTAEIIAALKGGTHYTDYLIVEH